MNVLKSKDIFPIIRETLNNVDKRLIGHGERVAYIVYEILKTVPEISDKERIDIVLCALLHDIGAYKTDNIDDMMVFENYNIWEHSIYGYLFLKSMSPLGKYGDAVLFHHLRYRDFSVNEFSLPENHLAGLINLADRVDMLMLRRKDDNCLAKIQDKINSGNNYSFSPYWVEKFNERINDTAFLNNCLDASYVEILAEFMATAVFTEEEKKQFLRMIAYSIDFRSEFMVLHTVTTVCVSIVIAKLMNLDELCLEKIFYGALLHDIGKVACPVEILEKAGRLTFDEMEIIKRHVVVTSDIIKNYVDDDVHNIAARHHEKLDGSGYPLGLSEADLTVSERIVAVADIMSALIRKRSYKEEYSALKTKSILTEMMEENKICPKVTSLVIDNFDLIIEQAVSASKDTLDLYNGIHDEYLELITKFLKIAS